MDVARSSGRRWTVVGVVLLGGALAAAISFRAGVGRGLDTGADLAGALSWPAVTVMAVLGAAHYFAAAVAARAVSGAPLDLGETVLAQLAAATANRVTPAGLGGGAVLARFFHQRADLSASGAVGAASLLAVVGAVADLFVLLTLAIAGGLVGLHGGAAELGRLARTVSGWLGAFDPVWLAISGAVIVLVFGLAASVRRRRASRTQQLTALLAPLRHLVRRPRALLTAVVSSGSTTLALGLAFAASTWVVPDARPAVSIGALVVGYMVASAAAGALPVPAGFGTTDAAMTAVLVSDGVPLSRAVAVVASFRVITYWAPAVVGLAAAQRLRSRGAL